jgi:hypothetical protein
MATSEPFNGSPISVASFNANWSLPGWASGKGEDTASGWRPAAAYPAVNGAISNARRGGYELRFTYVSANTYNVTLTKWQGGTQTALASKSSYAFANGNSLALVDSGGVVSVWTNTGSGFSKILSATDSTFSGGNAGIEGSGNNTRLANFKAGTLSPNTTLEPGTETEWRLRNSNSAGNPDVSFLGLKDVKEVVGDWNGDGIDTIGLYDSTNGLWALRNSNTPGKPDIQFSYGGAIWTTAIAGDWDDNGTDTIGVVNG